MQLSNRHTPISIFTGRSNPALAREIANSYGRELGVLSIKEFSDGEIYVHYEESIRGTDLFIIQSTCPPADNWIELLLLIEDRKSTRLNSSHVAISYAVFCLKKKKYDAKLKHNK